MFIRLSDIGLAAGDEITVAEGGNGYYLNVPEPTMAFRNTTGSLHAAFTTTTAVILGSDAETALAHLHTALPLVAPQDAYGFVSYGTFSTGLPTDVPCDFHVFRAGAVFAGFEFAGSLAPVPNGANFLAVGLLDSSTPDNRNDASDPLRPDIYTGFLQPRAISVAEPSAVAAARCRRAGRAAASAPAHPRGVLSAAGAAASELRMCGADVLRGDRPGRCAHARPFPRSNPASILARHAGSTPDGIALTSRPLPNCVRARACPSRLSPVQVFRPCVVQPA